ncbi:tRNA adenosine(34) deaminase TadA [Desulfurivibrio dismutans]|uniref:tRNA adenosine(34) deaminase TadA n=1 Tax=Desulfurivibrio dismutans TaxID=1398908 RepID=UPI0023DC1E5A|nr:tRNA adenosine(34) deaminase TadA [Desulfurivibrio alkaliphilus]MDF1614546.1 tRNA adenosine(34) deaminase TadA [Desulfurivibrio alkaliphilus]
MDQPPGEQLSTAADVAFMRQALSAARAAAERGEVPVGSLLVDRQGELLAIDGNRTIGDHDPSAHAEIVVLRQAAARLGNHRLTGTTLYVTLEPCLMCVGAMIQARIARLVFGALDPKAGAVVSLYQLAADPRLNHRLQVTSGVLAAEGGGLLRDFFRSRRT